MDDIDVDVDGNPTLTSSNFVPRYPPGDPRHKISDEEAERMKKEFIAAKLKGFTKVGSCKFAELLITWTPEFLLSHIYILKILCLADN